MIQPRPTRVWLVVSAPHPEDDPRRLESTMRYLKPTQNAAVREKVNEIFGEKNGK
jgi:hypothetical protein